MNTAASRRAVAPEQADRATPPPLQQPDQHGRRQDPAAEAWLPESTLDPATRAWLTGEDRRRSEPVAPVPVQTPDTFAPRSAPTHVHGAGSGLGEWTGAGEPPRTDRSGAQQGHEPTLDPDAFPAEPLQPEDDPEVTRLAPRTGAPAPDVVAPPAVAAEPSAPFWAAPQDPTPAPSAPSWWIGRPGDDAPTTTDAHSGDGDGAGPVEGASAPPAGPSIPASPGNGAPPAPDAGPQDASAPVDDVPVDADPVAETPRAGDTAVVEPLVERRAPRPTPLVQPATHPTTCHVCGHHLEPDDIFCNECGAVRPAVTAAFTGPVVPLPLARPDWAATAASTADDAVLDEPNSDEAVEPDDEVSEPGVAGRPDVDQLRVPPMPTSPAPSSTDPLDDEPAAWAPTAAPLPPVPGMPGPALPTRSADAYPSSSDADEAAQLDEDEVEDADEVEGEDADVDADADEDVDQTRIVTKTPARAPFMLHFSTGERIGVHGTGLLGRLPRAEPGERFDDLLTIHDPGKSVSKTHLEIGRDGNDLWVSDRFSGNGSVIRHIDGSIRRCEPGRRYRVERGARVDIGEQFFLVQ
ncbi:hypothetical protein [Curtobacterium sp. VKM Ac-2922]|uniref:hypothetical protein n=1 Tax=Curtobacterium sp. VKM Ac-2922 TaxID=2929475 RepID=UPI001FB3B3CE|nr:hypothetical protein [Curtobacterium sp. VKM Ac-2922]MCJ1713802.1 hypothetical protein [Curtobacterium sp. VKM Ac-2922]